MCHGRQGHPDRAVPSREMAYRMWIMDFLRFHRGSDGWRHPRSMGAVEVEAFLSHLAVERKVAAAT
jgi:hypothetical protein